MMKKLRKIHKNAVCMQQMSKWYRKEYERTIKASTAMDAHFYELPPYSGTIYRGIKRWLNHSDKYRRTKWVGIAENYPKPQGKRKDEVLI